MKRKFLEKGGGNLAYNGRERMGKNKKKGKGKKKR